MSQSVQQQIGSVTIVVENYDDAIEFYTQKLQFTLVEDTDLGGGNVGFWFLRQTQMEQSFFLRKLFQMNRKK